MRFVRVGGAGVERVLARHSLGLAEDHDLLEEEDGEGLRLGRLPVLRLREVVHASQRAALEQFALSRYLALETLKRKTFFTQGGPTFTGFNAIIPVIDQCPSYHWPDPARWS